MIIFLSFFSICSIESIVSGVDFLSSTGGTFLLELKVSNQYRIEGFARCIIYDG